MMKVRLADQAETGVILALRREAALWLAEQGSDQWRLPYPSAEGMTERITASIRAGETWIVEEAGHLLATITVNDSTDEGLWTSDEIRTALFAHRMILDRSIAAGRGIGSEMLDYAGELAERRGREWLRLDCWTTNRQLHNYYLSQGFEHVRTVQGHYSGSAACFQRPASARHGAGVLHY